MLSDDILDITGGGYSIVWFEVILITHGVWSTISENIIIEIYESAEKINQVRISVPSIQRVSWFYWIKICSNSQKNTNVACMYVIAYLNVNI